MPVPPVPPVPPTLSDWATSTHRRVVRLAPSKPKPAVCPDLPVPVQQAFAVEGIEVRCGWETQQPAEAQDAPTNTPDAWPELTDANREYLLGPHRFPGPCPFCGGRTRHGALCNELRQSWGPAMPWGKHRGKPLSEVPKDYLKWLLRKTDLRSDLRADIEKRLKK